ncbi:hypothetical protein [Bosea sp. LC85]|uniref:hypothetical protein n=1 Tax=Bosea sp. LC85 TaxID=1502851 RepID=UPI000697156F|nr:hypothetical protein [Bosea sp. LC85]
MLRTLKGLAVHLETTEARLGLRQRSRKPDDRAKFHIAIEAFACNLAALALTRSPLPLAVPRRSGVMWSATRYRPEVYGQHFLDALDLMTHPEVGLAKIITRGFRLEDGRRRQTTIRPTQALLDAIDFVTIDWGAFERQEDPEVLILRGPKDRKTGQSNVLDYKDTATTRKLRKQVQTINRYLTAAPLFLLPASSPTPSETLPADPTRRTVRRIFNNGLWTEGGRLFDGFWEIMPRQERFERLRIGTAGCPEGEPIANVDFGQLFASLAYRQCDLLTPEGDLYAIWGDGSHRDGFKRLLNALLFARGPLTRWPQDTSSCFPKGTKLQAVLADIRHHHAPIAHLFGTGIGFSLMAIESAILIDALLRLFASGVTALPLHDSVLVAQSNEEAAREAMQASHATYARSCAKLRIDKV